MLDVDLAATIVGLNKISIRSRFTGVPLMCRKAVDHLDAIARQAITRLT